MQYQAYPTCQSRKNRLRLHFQKSSKKSKVEKSGSLVTNVKGKKRKSLKTIYFHELDHSEWFGAYFFFEFWIIQKFQKPNLTSIKKKWVPEFFWTWNFQGMFLTLYSTISESLKKILRQKIYQKNFLMIKNTVFLKFLDDPVFFWKNRRVRFLPL